MDLEDDTSRAEFRFVRDCFDYGGYKRQSEDQDPRVSHFRRRFDQKSTLAVILGDDDRSPSW